jgi:uncharacterized protein (TIGR02217 family)
MAFDDSPRFDDGIALGSSGGPGFSTSIVVVDSGAEERVSRWAVPKFRYDVSEGIKNLDDLITVRDFYIARRGPARGFRFKDFTNFTTAANSRSAPSDTDVSIGTGDGVETKFQLKKTYTSGSQVVTKEIKKPVVGTTVVALDGTPQGSGWTVSAPTGLVTFSSPPGAGVDVTAGCEFDMPVRFGEDLDEVFSISLPAFDLGQITSIPLVELLDGVDVTEDFFFGGSKLHDPFTADVTITRLEGLLHVFEANTTGLKVRLQTPTNLATGGLIFAISNTGSQSIVVEDHLGGTISTVVAGGFLDVYLGLDQFGVKEYVAR